MNENLIQAVKDGLNCDDEEELMDTLQDICSYGASSGFGSFIYYSDTCKFFMDNKREIIELAQEMAESMGEDIISMIAGFVCLRAYCQDREGKDEIGRAIYGTPEEDDTQVINALTWFALEEVARFVTDN